MSSLRQQIDAIREEWGERLLILGHHYQRGSVLQHADERGDSLELARKAVARPEVERIVFCGVRFMAESADVLSGSSQTVYMPETAAGCPMADMCTAEQMEAACAALAAGGDEWLPVVYVNSSAAVKACCGARGGSTCTSSNAARVFEWALGQGKKILFLPDEHLGINTARDLGIADGQVQLYDPARPTGGLSAAQLSEAKVVVWKGFCLVHTAFTLDHIAAVRHKLPDARIIVHPECPKDVVRAADAHGSTSQIIRYVEDAADGSTIVIGTEVNLVTRLAEDQQGRVTVKALTPSVCANMAKTNEQNLLALLEEWPAEREVRVADAVAAGARLALERMLAI